MLIILGKRSFEKAVERLAEDASRRVDDELKGLKSVTDLSAKVRSLRDQVEVLEIEKAKRTEDFARREREIEHKVGLERTRQAQELEASKREAVVSVREENLKKDKARFEEQMKFQNERFTSEVGYLKDMLGQIIERLPTANLTGNITPKTRAR